MEPHRVVSQTANEHGRLVVDGRRTDDRTRCALLLVQETGDTWALYPHGAGQLGVRLSQEAAQAVAASDAPRPPAEQRSQHRR